MRAAGTVVVQYLGDPQFLWTGSRCVCACMCACVRRPVDWSGQRKPRQLHASRPAPRVPAFTLPWHQRG